MNNKYLFLAAAFAALLMIPGTLGGSDTQNVFGVEINVWITRALWLFGSLSFFLKYWKIKKAGQDSNIV